jgi:hypothetical protein
MVDFLDKWQEGLSGIATLIAAAIAYVSVMKQIKSDRKLAYNEMIRRRKTYVTVLSIAITGHVQNLNSAISDLVQIRSSLQHGVNLRDRLNRIEAAIAFDISLFDSWDMYSQLPSGFVEKLIEFREDARHQAHMLDMLRESALPELPLLRSVQTQDTATELTVSRLGALISAVEATRDSASVISVETAKGLTIFGEKEFQQ